jgi:hypothetical protein
MQDLMRCFISSALSWWNLVDVFKWAKGPSYALRGRSGFGHGEIWFTGVTAAIVLLHSILPVICTRCATIIGQFPVASDILDHCFVI